MATRPASIPGARCTNSAATKRTTGAGTWPSSRPRGSGARRRLARAACALLCALGGALALAEGPAEPEQDARPSSEGSFQRLTFSELLGIAPEPGLDFTVEIPGELHERRSSSTTTGTLLWATPADWSLIRHGRPASGRNGLVVVQRSASLHHDPEQDQFLDGTGLTERNLPERLGKQGAHGVAVRRLDHPPVPILLLESELKGGERLCVLYVQIGARARTVAYLGHSPWNATDDLVWGRLRDAVAAGR